MMTKYTFHVGKVEELDDSILHQLRRLTFKSCSFMGSTLDELMRQKKLNWTPGPSFGPRKGVAAYAIDQETGKPVSWVLLHVSTAVRKWADQGNRKKRLPAEMIFANAYTQIKHRKKGLAKKCYALAMKNRPDKRMKRTIHYAHTKAGFRMFESGHKEFSSGDRAMTLQSGLEHKLNEEYKFVRIVIDVTAFEDTETGMYERDKPLVFMNVVVDAPNEKAALELEMAGGVWDNIPDGLKMHKVLRYSFPEDCGDYLDYAKKTWIGVPVVTSHFFDVWKESKYDKLKLIQEQVHWNTRLRDISNEIEHCQKYYENNPAH